MVAFTLRGLPVSISTSFTIMLIARSRGSNKGEFLFEWTNSVLTDAFFHFSAKNRTKADVRMSTAIFAFGEEKRRFIYWPPCKNSEVARTTLAANSDK